MGWFVTSSARSVRDMGGNTVLDIEAVEWQTTPTGIGAGFGVPYYEWRSGQAEVILTEISNNLEELARDHHVVGGSYALDIAPNGLLQDYEDLVVEYDRTGTGLPPLHGTVRIPVINLISVGGDAAGLGRPGDVAADFTSAVEAEYLRLGALAQGG